jgi:NADPH2:quinone reductase
VSSEEKAALARQHGCHETIIYTRESFAKRVRELTDGRGVPVVYDSVGKATFAESLDCLQPRGTLVCFGNASGKPDPFDILQLSQKGSLYLTRPTLVNYVSTRAELLASSSALFQALRSGVKVEIGQRFALADASAAHHALESRGTIGSTLLTL